MAPRRAGRRPPSLVMSAHRIAPPLSWPNKLRAKPYAHSPGVDDLPCFYLESIQAGYGRIVPVQDGAHVKLIGYNPSSPGSYRQANPIANLIANLNANLIVNMSRACIEPVGRAFINPKSRSRANAPGLPLPTHSEFDPETLMSTAHTFDDSLKIDYASNFAVLDADGVTYNGARVEAGRGKRAPPD